MKNILESSEVFTAYATIDAGYFMMQEAQKEFDKGVSKGGFNYMIDKATGYAEDRLKKHVAYLCMCLDDIIEAKKVVQADYASAVEMKENLLKMVQHKQ